MQRILRVVFAAAICCALVSGEQLASPVPDARYKADLLLVVAHPDDETAVAAYLANVVFDERRKVAVVFATNGSAGGNFVGNEQAASLGLIREIEARRALGSLGIFNVWFLGSPDTPGQDPIISLENWPHGAAIERLTRIIRLTRPEVLLTWIPANLSGEHGDHQAAGIISLEASDAANDALMFPEQIALPRDRLNIRNSGEGLKLWRVKKLYFLSEIESFRPKKSGPIFDPTATSGRQNVPYYRLAAEEASHHLTQAETGQVAKRVLAAGADSYLQHRINFVAGPFWVTAPKDGAVFDGVTGGIVAPSMPKPNAEAEHELSVELGGAWAFYKRFWHAHGLDFLANLVPAELQLQDSTKIWIPYTLTNASGAAKDVSLTIQVPSGWREYTGSGTYRLASHSAERLQAVIEAPGSPSQNEERVNAILKSDNRVVGTVSLQIRRPNRQ